MGFLLFMLAFGLFVAAALASFKLNPKPTFHFARAVPIFAAAMLAVLLWMSYTPVNTGTVDVVTRQGKVYRTLTPGPHWILPFLDNQHPISTQTHIVRPNETASSHDLQEVHTQVTLAYHFDPEYVSYIYTQLSDASENAVENKVINPAIIEAVKSCTAQYDAQSLITSRSAVRDGIESVVTARLAAYHIIPETVSITDFDFSKDFNSSIEAKVKAEQDAEKAKNDLTRIKVEAEQKIAQAQAEATSLEVQRQQITPELLQLRTIEMLNNKWNGQLPEVMVGGSGALPMMDILKAAQQARK